MLRVQQGEQRPRPGGKARKAPTRVASTGDFGWVCGKNL